MFNSNTDFYPTPPYVIDLMLKPIAYHGSYGYSLPYQRILEPSAGKGDIVDHMIKHYHQDKRDIFCVENDPNLCAILNDKGYTLIDRDFLQYGERYIFDLIVMNPPFSNGVDHLLKAWDVLAYGDIVCLLNAETILNPYSEKRKLLLRTIEAHGSYTEIGQVFLDAERKTGVECVIVYLHKEKQQSSWQFETKDMDFDSATQESEFNPNPLASADLLESLVRQYTIACDILVKQNELQKQYNYYTRGISTRIEEPDKQDRKQREDELAVDRTLHEQIDELKAQFWSYVFYKTKIGQVTTSQFRKNFDTIMSQTKRLAFTSHNVISILQVFYLNQHEIMKDCLLNTFDKATAYHKKNIVWVEGWKTNKAYRVNQKIILPRGFSYDARGPWWNLSYGDSCRDFYDDMDKSLCYLSGEKIEKITLISKAMERHFDDIRNRRISYDTIFESTFFKVKVHKKETVHLWFKDKDLLDRFNIFAADNRNWVSDGEN